MIYLLRGTDNFSLQERLDGIKDAVGTPDVRDVNIVVLDGKNVTFDEVVANANTVPFLAEKRLVIVEGLLGKFERGQRTSGNTPLNTGEWEGLPEALETLLTTTDLVFVESKVSISNPLFKLAKMCLKDEKFDAPHHSELRQWIVNRAHIEGIEIEQRAADTMANSIGSNLWVIVSELRKLALYAHGRTISHEDIVELVPYEREANIFATADAMIDGRSSVAIKLVNQLLHDGASPQYILSMMARQSRLLILAKEHQAQSATNEEKAERLGLRGFVLNKTLQQAERTSPGRLIQIHGALLKADHLMKTTSTDEELVLDMMIVEIASLPRAIES